jgi:hypothetical protein
MAGLCLCSWISYCRSFRGGRIVRRFVGTRAIPFLNKNILNSDLYGSVRRHIAVLDGEAEGEATMARLAGEAEGNREILNKMADGFRKIVNATNGDPDAAAAAILSASF